MSQHVRVERDKTRGYRTVVLAVTVLVLLVPAIVAIPGNINEIFYVVVPIEVRAAIVVGAILVIGAFLFYVAWHAEPGVGATLQGTALWLPWMAALASSALYLASASGPKPTEDIDVWATMARDRAWQSLLVGGGLAGALWLLHAIVDHGYPKASRQSPGWYGLLKDAIAGQRMLAAETSDACPDPNATIRRNVSRRLGLLDASLAKPGLKWVTRAGFNVAWSEYHAAEEALIGVVSKASLIDVALSDLLRLDGSDMQSHATLQRDLQAALIELDAKLEPYSRSLVPKDPNAPPVTVVATSGTAPSTVARARVLARRIGSRLSRGAGSRSTNRPSTSEAAKPQAVDYEAEGRARTVIQTIHSSLDTYRGARWAELGRARWQLMLTTTIAGIVAFLVLALALIRGVHPDQLMAGWAYFLVGAAAGLFLRLRLASDESQVTDDYGLEAARVFQTPLLSGMAAIIGVVLMASLAGSSLGDILTPQSQPATVAVESSAEAEGTGAAESGSPEAAAASPEATESANPTPAAAAAQSTTSTLSNAFSLATYPLGIVIALAFGLTPNLVLQRLGVSTQKAKKELVATRPT